MTAERSLPTETLLVHGPDAITLETRLTESAISKCNLQEHSPLFAILPPELRNSIFELATQSYDDPKHLYQETDYCYRPGHHAKQRTDTCLLLTCRLIWLETNHLPLQQATPTFWFMAEERRPDWTHSVTAPGRYALRCEKREHITEDERFSRFMKSLTPKNAENLRNLRIMGQSCWLESNQINHLLATRRHTRMPSRLIITVRHTDWWWWEYDRPLDIKTRWLLKSVLQNPTIRQTQQVVLELETLEKNMEQLKLILGGIRTVCGHDQGWVMEDKGETLSWTGPTNIGGTKWEVYSGLKELKYKVHSLVWKRHQDPVRKPPMWSGILPSWVPDLQDPRCRRPYSPF